MVSTDDAYVGAKNATLAAKVSGYVADGRGRGQRPCRAGDSDQHRRRRLPAGGADRARQDRDASRRPSSASASRSPRSRPRVDQAKAQLASAKAGATRADLELKRQQDLATRRFNSRRRSSRRRPTATRPSPPCTAREAAIDRAAANVDVLQGAAGRGRAHAAAIADGARQGRARSVLHRHPRAVRRRDRQPRRAGRRLRAADAAARQPGAARRRLHRRQLQGDAARRLQPGPAGDASASTRCPAARIEGRVASFAPASGSVFSLLPPDNATGNFTKIVQRLPVRILVPADGRRAGRAAARHVGGRERQHQARRAGQPRSA